MAESQDHTEYNLPRKHATESARLHDQAAGYTELMHNKIVHASLKDPSKMIDVGCSTGTVTRYFGTQYPSATVDGIDISPVPPFVSTPANVSYVKGAIQSVPYGRCKLFVGSAQILRIRTTVAQMMLS